MTDKAKKQPAMHYVLSTHWDREWHKPFQSFRYRLVHLLDDVIDGLQSGVLRGPFQCDGQSVILADYLEIRPHQRDAVRELAATGRFSIGPWFVMPDEFIVSGESLVRNLRMGRDDARALGGVPSDAGFVNDIFGHCSQLPQMFAGFGIRAAFLWRGTNVFDTRWMLWEGADGTQLPAYRFANTGYGDFAIQVRGASDPAGPYDEATRREKLSEYIASETEACAGLPVLLFDGSDHLAFDRACYELITERMDGEDGASWSHGALDDYVEDVLVKNAAQLEVKLRGELRDSGRHRMDVDQQWLIPGVLSSRPSLKLANAACETQLCQWAEPLWAWASFALDRPYPTDFLRVAWRLLLENHPHDSICGCSVDTVHEDMHYRFRQCSHIAGELIEEASGRIAASIEGDVGEEEVRCVVFNPLPAERSGVATLELEIPTTWPSFQEFFGYEAKPSFRLWDRDGQEIPYQRLHQAKDCITSRTNPLHHPQPRTTHRVAVAVELSVPAGGYECITIRPGEPGVPTRHPVTPSLVSGVHSAENAHLRLDIEADGTLTVLHKASGEVYGGLLRFEDGVDIGDGWYHGQAVNDAFVASTGASHEIALVHDGPLRATFRIRTRMDTHASFDFVAGERSADRVEMVLDHRVTLYRDAEHLEIETELDNTACDHRLRALFPTRAETDTFLTDTPFDVVERAIAPNPEDHLYREIDSGTRPQHSWSALFDGKRGLAVAAMGMHEVAVRDDAERTLRLTVLRATRRTIMTKGEPGGQELGKQVFQYRVLPFSGEPDLRRLFELGQATRAGLLVVHCDARDQRANRSERSLAPSSASYCLEGAAVVTAFERHGDAVLLRCFNPESGAASCGVHLAPMLAGCLKEQKVARVDLEDNEVETIGNLVDGAIQFEMQPKEIATLRFC